ncbi:MAG: hypothetical protein WD845_12175, partial [Pirellulales bacterium]
RYSVIASVRCHSLLNSSTDCQDAPQAHTAVVVWNPLPVSAIRERTFSMESIARSSEMRPLPPEREASWRLAACALAVLFSLEFAYMVFWMRPTDMSNSEGLRWYFRAAAAGAAISLPVLLATAAALAPGRVAVRLLVCTSLAVLSTYAMIVGSWRGNLTATSATQVHEAASTFIAYLVFLLPAFVMVRFRCWTSVPSTSDARTSRGQLSISGLLLVTACTASVLGLGRWVLPLGLWPDSPDLWGNLLLVIGMIGGSMAWSCLPILPLAALVLATERRRKLTLAMLATTGIVIAVLFGLLYLLMSPGTHGLTHFAALLSGAYLSALTYLLIIRACGYRLARQSRDQPANGLAPS